MWMRLVAFSVVLALTIGCSGEPQGANGSEQGGSTGSPDAGSASGGSAAGGAAGDAGGGAGQPDAGGGHAGTGNGGGTGGAPAATPCDQVPECDGLECIEAEPVDLNTCTAAGFGCGDSVGGWHFIDDDSVVYCTEGTASQDCTDMQIEFTNHCFALGQ